MKGPASLAGLKKGEKKSSTRPGHPHLQHLSRHQTGIKLRVSSVRLIAFFCPERQVVPIALAGDGEDGQKKKPKQPSIGLRFSIQTECSYEALDQ